jgi:preprotein translocase subunit SecD
MGCLAATLGLIAILLLGVRTSVDLAGTWSPWTPAEVEGLASPQALSLESTTWSGPSTCGQYRVTRTYSEGGDGVPLDAARAVIEARLTGVGAPDAVVTAVGEDLVAVEVGMDPERLRELILAPGRVVFLPVPPELDAEVVAGEPLPSGMVDLEPLFATAGVASARAGHDESGILAIDLTLTDEAARSLDQHAAAHPGERLAIVFDGVVWAAPVIRARSFDGEVRMSGSWSPDEAQLSAAIIGAGPLPGPLDEIHLGPCD